MAVWRISRDISRVLIAKMGMYAVEQIKTVRKALNAIPKEHDTLEGV